MKNGYCARCGTPLIPNSMDLSKQICPNCKEKYQIGFPKNYKGAGVG